MFSTFPVDYVADVLENVGNDLRKATAFLLEIEIIEDRDEEETPGELPLERVDS
jgi:hypothetical protein